MYERQALLIPDGMKRATAIVVGCGMLGSWTLHSLVRTMRGAFGFDFDTVGPENIGTQAFSFSDETMNKANALSMHMQGLPYSAIPVAFEGTISFPAGRGPLVVVSAVDSFEARRMVAQATKDYGADLFIDTRAAGTVGVVVTAKPEDLGAYIATLESDVDAPNPECGAEGTAFVGLWTAAQVTSSIARHFRGLPVAYKVVHDVGMDARILTQATAPQLEAVAES